MLKRARPDTRVLVTDNMRGRIGRTISAISLSRQLEPYIWAQEEIGMPGDDEELLARARQKTETLKALAVWIFHKAAKHLPDPPDETVPINPLAISLQPDKWEEDGLFSGDGLTLAQAIERLPGIEEMDLDARGAQIVGTAPATSRGAPS